MFFVGLKVWQQWLLKEQTLNKVACGSGRTTEGMNGGVIFLAIRSSQLMGEKKEWYLSSSWKEKEKLYEGNDSKHDSELSVLNLWAHSQSRPLLPASWCAPSAGAPPAAPCQRLTRWASEPVFCAGYCCTSQLCYDYRRVAVWKNKKTLRSNWSCVNFQEGQHLQRFHSQVHRASRREPIPDTTSPLCGRTLVFAEPQVPNTTT